MALSPIHQGLSNIEALWHVRAGLNVAALSCSGYVGNEIVSDYNAFLKVQQAPLAAAYRQQSDRYAAHGGNWQRAFDTDMTKLYNHFAAPDAQPEFCRLAAGEVKRALAAPADDDLDWAGAMLARLDRPFVAPAPALGVQSFAAFAPPQRASGKAVPAAASADRNFAWRIQLGAFGSRANAERAWASVRGRSAVLGRMNAHYEPVPGRPLTRLQVTNVQSRSHAIQLCAQAAAAGFDCFPVRRD